MDKNLPPLIQALLTPERYAHPVQQVELVQTHISWVLLAGDWAYKIKKPLKLRFLDFSTLELRHQLCQEELRLNRRFSPELYHSVVPISHTQQDPQLDGPGVPIEYAVKMRRFEESARLDRVCARGELQPAQLSELAAALWDWQSAAAKAPAGSMLGEPQTLMAPVRDNCTDLLAAFADAGLKARILALRAWSETQFQQLAPQMQARKRDGWVRECHGDLHLANLVLLGEHIRPFDCIEFSDSLRWIDVVSDMAFVYVDLLAHGQPGLASWFLNEALGHSGHYAAAALLRFYAVYRALVRAKVAAIGQTQDAATYLALAERLATAPTTRLIITHGVSGCGKTTASTALLHADTHGQTIRLRADVERKRLFGLAPLARSNSAHNAGIYTPQAHIQTYERLHTLAGLLLRAGWSVVVDAAFLQHKERAMFRALAQETGAQFSILAPQAPLAELRARIQARAAHGRDASEATLVVLEQQLQTLEPLTSSEQENLLQL